MLNKKLFIAGLFATASLFTLNSCSEKNDDTTDQISSSDQELAQEALETETLENEMVGSINTAILVSEQSYGEEAMASKSYATESGTSATDCMTLSIKPLVGGFPKTITIDFGDGCEGESGIYRAGKIEVTITDTLLAPGVTYSVTFTDFSIEDYSVSGTLYVENTGTAAAPSFYQEMDLAFTGSDGVTITKSKTIDRAWSEGASTSTYADDVFLITGSADVASSTGNFYTYDITSPLKITYGCDPIKEGIMVVDYTGLENPLTIDFGDGECDWKATLSQAGRNSVEINFGS